MTNRAKVIHYRAKVIRYQAKVPANYSPRAKERASVMDLCQAWVSAWDVDPGPV